MCTDYDQALINDTRVMCTRTYIIHLIHKQKEKLKSNNLFLIHPCVIGNTYGLHLLEQSYWE